jgi:hypothetical protein
MNVPEQFRDEGGAIVFSALLATGVSRKNNIKEPLFELQHSTYLVAPLEPS